MLDAIYDVSSHQPKVNRMNGQFGFFTVFI